MRLLIADDNVEFRKRLAEIVRSIRGIEVIGDAGDVPGTIEAIRKMRPDMVILDFQMPGGNGLDVLAAVKHGRNAPMVIVLTIGSRSEYQARCNAAGAEYFFEKSSELYKMTSLLKKLSAKSAVAHNVNHSS